MTKGEDLTRLIDFLLPGGCVVCRRWIPAGQEGTGDRTCLVCDRCRSRLAPASWPRCPRCHHPKGTGRTEAEDCLECRDWPEELAAARYAYVLAPPASDLVHALKYEGWRELAPLMSAAMARTVSRYRAGSGGEPHRDSTPRVVVVAVPTTERRLRDRGYNQARLLAEGVARALDRSLIDALTRQAAEASQTRLAPSERRENVRDAFELTRGAARLVGGAHVLLVDDVLTTGATAGEASRTLVDRGAVSVTLVTFARALPRVLARAA